MASMRLRLTARQAAPDPDRGVVIPVDIAKEWLDWRICRLGSASKPVRSSYNRAGLEALREAAERLSREHEVWIAFEPTGPYSICLREWLLQLPYRVVQVNPYHVKRTREVRDNSPGSSDPKSAQVIADLVWQGCYQSIQPLAPHFAELRSLSVDWRSVNADRTRVRNELQGLFAVWFPEIRELFWDVLCKSACAIVRRYSSPQAIGRARLKSLEGLLFRVRRRGTAMPLAAQLKEAAKQTIASPHGQVARHEHIRRLLDDLERLEGHRERLRQAMTNALSGDEEAQCLLSIPGVGVITVAVLLGECGSLGGYRSYESLEKHVGLKLSRVSSGKYTGQLHITKRGRAQARLALGVAVVGMVTRRGLFREYSERHKAQHQPWSKRRIAIARKLLKLMYVLARRGEQFDLARFSRTQAGDDRVILQGMSPHRAA